MLRHIDTSHEETGLGSGKLVFWKCARAFDLLYTFFFYMLYESHVQQHAEDSLMTHFSCIVHLMAPSLTGVPRNYAMAPS